MIAVDKGIEIPPKNWSRGDRKCLYPWREMEVGDSFFIPNGGKVREIRGVASRAGQAARYTGMKFTCRAVDGGFRVWRIA